MLVVVKTNGINWDVFSGHCHHTVYPLGGSTEHFTIDDGIKVMAYGK